MQRIISEKISRLLLPTVLILFILEVLSLPMVLGITYSGRSESPDLVLSYTEGKLTWNTATGINESGVAELNLFDAVYENAASTDGENIVAPGTEGISIVRLKNEVSGNINYKAVLYSIRTNDELPVEVSFGGEALTDTEDYPLPKGVSAEQVLRAVDGTVKGGEIVDFDISWIWEYDASADQNTIDTVLGNKDEADQITVGMYIVVEDNNDYIPDDNDIPDDDDNNIPNDNDSISDNKDYITPESPKTGDNSNAGFYFVLMLISLFVLIILILERRREKKCGQQ